MSLKKSFLKRAKILTGLILVINIISCLEQYYYLFELFSHFRLQYSAFFFLSTLVFTIFFNKKWVALSLLGLFFNIAQVIPIYFPIEIDTNEKTNKVSILLANVFSGNQSYSPFLDEIKQKQADIVVVLELSPQWAEELKSIKGNYPHQKVIARLDNFGIGLYSRHVLEDIKVEYFANNGIPSITAQIKIDNDYIHLIATHPLPPLGRSLAQQQSTHLEYLSFYIQRKMKSDPIVVAGDLNITPWSASYRKLKNDSNLRNTRQSYGIYPTWPTNKFIGPLLQIPLDHVLVSKNITTQKFERLNLINSDHYPIYVELKF